MGKQNVGILRRSARRNVLHHAEDRFSHGRSALVRTRLPASCEPAFRWTILPRQFMSAKCKTHSRWTVCRSTAPRQHTNGLRCAAQQPISAMLLR